MENNRILLRGLITQPPRFSHESHAKRFYLSPMDVPRLSGTVDQLNLLFPEALLPGLPVGKPVEVTGQVRTFNNRSGVGSRLVITVLARTAKRCGEEWENSLRLSGVLCKPPILRRTPLGREICDLMLAVPRDYGRSDYLPCIAWGSTALQAACLSVGDRVSLTGRLQSRSYTKLLEDRSVTRVAFEVSVTFLSTDGQE